MKTHIRYSIFILFLGALCVSSAFAQYGKWLESDQNPFLAPGASPTPLQFRGIFMQSVSTGWAVGRFSGMTGDPGAMLQTTDSGTTWYFRNPLNPLIGAVPAGSEMRSVYFVGPNGWIVGNNNAIIFSSNNGTSWVQQGSIVNGRTLNKVAMWDGHNGLIVGDGGVIEKTTDGGNTWTLISTAGFTNNLVGLSLAGVGSSGGVAYIAGTSGLIRKTTDYGDTWFQPHLAPIVTFDDIAQIQFVNPSQGYISADSLIFTTNDGGQTWYPFGTGYGLSFSTFRFIDYYNGWFFNDASAILFTNNGGASKWIQQGAPASTGTVTEASFPSPLFGYACGPGFIIRYDGRYPVIGRSKTFHDFGKLLCENPVQDIVDISNTGNLDLNITGVWFDGANANEFHLVSPSGISQQFPLTIPPGASVPFVVEFKALNWGNKTSSMVIEHDSPVMNPARVLYRVNKDSSGFRVNTTNVRFNPACVGTTPVQQVQLIASGNVRPTIVSITQLSGDTVFKIISPTIPYQLPFLGAQPLIIKFVPNDLRNFSAVFQLEVQPCDRFVTINVTGTGAVTDLSLFPPIGVDFGKVESEDSSYRKITLRNVGNTEARIVDLRFTPPTPELTILDQPQLPWMFSAGTAKDLTIKFSPLDSMKLNATLCVIWDQPCPDTVCIPVTGKGVMDPFIAYRGVMNFKPLLCETEALQTVFIRNLGHAPLILKTATIGGTDKKNFEVTDPAFPAIVPPRDSIPVTVRFTSTTAGTKYGELVLVHNDSARNPSTLALVGKKDDIQISLDGDSLTYRRVCVGDSIRMKFDLLNPGSKTLTVNDIKIVYGGTDYSLVLPTMPFDVLPGQSQTLWVQFKPTVQGYQFMKMQIEADPCSLQSVMQINGVGIETLFRPNPTAVQFGDVKVGSTAYETVHITNAGIPAKVTKIFFSPTVSGMSLSPNPSLPIDWIAGKLDSLTIAFAPGTTGNIATKLYLVLQADCPDTLVIPVTARATSTSILVNRNVVPFTISPCSQQSLCDTVRVSNTGTSDLFLSLLAINQQRNIFSLQNPPTPPVLIKGGASLLLQVCAQPGFVGRDSATLVINSDDPTRPSISIPLVAHRDSARIAVSTSAYNFGVMTKCDPARSFDVTVTNTGTVPDSVTASLPNGTPFSISGASSLRLNTNETKTFKIVFSPGASGVFNTNLTLRSLLCGVTSTVALRGIRETISYTSTPSPLDFGDVTVTIPSSKNISVKSGHSRSSRIIGVRFSPALPQYVSNPSLPLTIDSLGTVSIPVTFTPSDTGIYRTSLCVIFDQPCNDTVCVTISGHGSRGVLVNSKNQMSFGEAAQCQAKRDTVSITNAGNQTVNLLSSAVTGTGSAYFQILNPIASSEPLTAGARREFYVLFNQAAAPDGIHSATMRITSDDQQRPTIDIQLNGTRTTQTLPTIALTNYGLVTLGQQDTRQIVIANNGTAEFCIRAILGGTRFTSNLSLPQCINPGQQINLPATFFPIDTSLVNETLLLVVDKTCPDTLRIPLTGRGAQGVVAQTLQVLFGTIASCTDKIDTIRITNRGNAVITYQSAALSGANQNQFVIASQPAASTNIQPNQTEIIIVRFNPSGFPDGAKTATLTTTITVNGQPQQFVTQLSAASTTLAFGITGNAFGQIIIGNTATQTITLTNQSTLPISVASIAVVDPAFTILSTTPQPPAVISPGGTITLSVRFTPPTNKAYQSNLDIRITSPCAITNTQLVNGEGIPQSIVNATLSIGTIKGKAKERVLIPILLQTDIGAADAGSYLGTISFNRTMLFPHNVVKENTLSSQMNVAMSYDHKLGEVTLTATGGKVAAGTGVLVYIECEVLIGDNLETPLRIGSQFDFTSGRAKVNQRTDGMFMLEGYCFCEGNRLMKVDGVFRLWQNYPNPFNPKTVIRYQLAEEAHTVLSITDAYGQEMIRAVDTWQSPGMHRVEIDASELSTGVYYYTIRSGKYFSAKKMVVAK